MTENGKLGSKLLGLVTSKETDFVEDHSIPVSQVMVSENLSVGTYPCSCTTFTRTGEVEEGSADLEESGALYIITPPDAGCTCK